MKICKEIGLELFFWLYWLKSLVIKVKRQIWNRCILLWWYRLWIRKDEFHKSLRIDIEAMLGMKKNEKMAYFRDLGMRRQIAHERDFASI